MNSRLEALIDQLQNANNLGDLQSLIETLRDTYDVEHAIYHAVTAKGEPYAALTYDADWVDHYIAQDYARIDPVVLGAYSSFAPRNWKSLDWSGKAQRAFLLEAMDAGVGNQGHSVPIRGPQGQFALFTFNSRATDGQWERFTQAHLRELLLIGHFIHQRARLIENPGDPMATQPLSPRERDTLTMLGLGRSRANIAERLKISEHTLRVYIESSRKKLGAANTTHAVALALARGEILL